MSQPTSSTVYAQSNAVTSTAPFVELFMQRDPAPSDVNYPIQKRWWNTITNIEWILVGFSSSSGITTANWEAVSTGGGSGANQLTANSGTAVASGGNINVVGSGGLITTSASGSTLTITSSGTISPANGGTGVSNPTARTIPIAEGASNFHFVGPLTAGQLLIGTNSSDPVAANLTAGSGISISNGNGSITINATGGGGGGSVNEVDAQSGQAFPVAGVINIFGDGDVITTSAVGQTVTAAITGIVPTLHGGTGVSAPAQFTIPVAHSSSPMSFVGPLTNGELLIGRTGNTPVAAGLTAGSGIVITPASGSITIAADSPVATLFTADSGSATPSGNDLIISGGTTGLTTSGASNEIQLTGALNSAHGGTGASSAPTAHTIPAANGSSPFQFLGPLTNGQLLIGNTGNFPSSANITAGSGITVTNGPGTITISSSGGGPTASAFTYALTSPSAGVTGSASQAPIADLFGAVWSKISDLHNDVTVATNTALVFHAPVNGYYYFSVKCLMGGLTSLMTQWNLFLTVNAGGGSPVQYEIGNSESPGVIFDVGHQAAIVGSLGVYLLSGDTVSFVVQILNGSSDSAFFSDTLSGGGTTNVSYVSGYLVVQA